MLLADGDFASWKPEGGFMTINTPDWPHRSVLRKGKTKERPLREPMTFRRARPFDALLAAISARAMTVGVIGLGYVGLPLAISAQEVGFGVIGFDVNTTRVSAVNAGDQVISYLPQERLQDALASGRFIATDDFDRLADVDAIVICVPTPLANGRDPDLSFVEATTREIAARLRPGQLVVLESTTWPGTTREVIRPQLEAAGAIIGETAFLAFSPEREDPGNEAYSTRTIPKVVGADDSQSLQLAQALYSAICTEVVPVNGCATAEAVKLTENIFRAVNIALVNELKVIYEAMDVDIWEVIDAAATKPFGFMPFYPGPGLGGHCIPIDPFYLTWKARQKGLATQFIELAGDINTAMPARVVERLGQALQLRTGRSLCGAKVLVLGAAYKRNIEDMRESPALVLIERLEEAGASTDYHDPFVPQIPATREHAALTGRKSRPLNSEMIRGYDAVLVATDHDGVDYEMVFNNANLLVDTRNVFARRGLVGDHVVKA